MHVLGLRARTCPPWFTPDITCLISRPVLAGRVHTLEDEQQRVPILREQQLLKVRKAADALRQMLERLLLVFEPAGVVRPATTQGVRVPPTHPEAVDMHAPFWPGFRALTGIVPMN